MNIWRAIQLPAADDMLTANRDEMLSLLGVLGVVVLLPLGLYDLVRGLNLVGFGTLAVALILAINAYAVRLKKAPPVPMALLLLAGIAAICLSIWTQGFYGALWSYPAVLFFYFVLSRRTANFYNLILCALVTLLVYSLMGLETTIRFVLTMMLTLLSSNIFLRIIGDLQRRLVELTIVDPLTGAFNRRHLDASLVEAVERKRRSGSPASVLLLDIDQFNQFNDQYGHAAGDGALMAVVILIQQRARKVDVLFRVGGEEFLLLLPDTTEKGAAVVAEQLRATVAEAELPEGRRVSISLGVSELRHAETPDAWYKQADDALYRAKAAGRNRVVLRSEPAP